MDDPPSDGAVDPPTERVGGRPAGRERGVRWRMYRVAARRASLVRAFGIDTAAGPAVGRARAATPARPDADGG